MNILRRWFATRATSYARDEGGAVIAYILLMFMMMIVAAGGAIDFMRHENVRTRLQNGLDRGVLAAAAFNQTIDAREVVAGYLKTAGFPSTVTLIVPPVVPILNKRRVEASAQLTIRTYFLKIIGINTLTVAATGAAEQQRQHVEISLALDISASMSRERTGPVTQPDTRERRLAVMRDTAQEFVSLVLNDDTIATTSVTLIPYSGQVSPGPTAFNYFVRPQTNNQFRRHNHSHCIDFTSIEMQNDVLPPAASRDQTPHFQYFNFEGANGHEADWGWCPQDDRRIRYFSNDPAALNADIANFRATDGTGTNIAFKWAISLLNPNNSAFFTQLRNAGEMTFTDRPAQFTDTDALKIIVIMTDGNTRFQIRPRVNEYQTNSDVNWYTNNFVQRRSTSTLTTEYDARMEHRALCTLAKSQGVVVFTVGFDIGTSGTAYSDLYNCASTASHFFNVNGLELGTAFRLIAATIQNLRLVE